MQHSPIDLDPAGLERLDYMAEHVVPGVLSAKDVRDVFFEVVDDRCDVLLVRQRSSSLHGPFESPLFYRRDRKSTRLNSSHDQISYAVFCLKKKKTNMVILYIVLMIRYRQIMQFATDDTRSLTLVRYFLS